MKIELWNSVPVYRGKHISVVEQEFSNGEKTGSYETVVRNNVSGIVSVLPVTEKGEVILIRQFRIPLVREVIEQPAGLNDVPGQSDLDAAKRELLEETGYASEDFEYMLSVPTSSGLTNETISCYIARNCKKISDILSLDASESITVFTLPIDTAFEHLSEEARKGNLVDPKVFMMIAWYRALGHSKT